MKKIIFILLMLPLMVSAQNTTDYFAKNDNVVGVGFGIGGAYPIGTYTTQSPTFGLQYDRGIMEFDFGGVIGAGGFLGYKRFVSELNYYVTDDPKVRYNIYIVGARASFHYAVIPLDNFDTYAGIMIAYQSIDADFDDNYPTVGRYKYRSPVYASLYAGAKYYFTPNVGAYLEAGYDVAWLTMGIAFKF